MKATDRAVEDIMGIVRRTFPQLAREIREEIEADFCDRRGLGQEFEQIDDEIQDEIRETWEKIIVRVLEKTFKAGG